MKRIKVLIVDDSAAARDGLNSILSPHTDIEIIGKAVDGQDAITKVNDLHPDIILMDTRMPVMGGVEATRRIKECFPEIKILMLTVHTSYIEEAIAAGADGYLRKDCPRDELLQTMRALSARPGTQNDYIMPR